MKRLVLLAALLLGGLAAGLRWPGFGKWALAGLLCLAPALNVVRVAAPLDMGFPVSDRFAYLPSLLWALGAGALLVAAARHAERAHGVDVGAWLRAGALQGFDIDPVAVRVCRCALALLDPRAALFSLGQGKDL